MSMKKLPVLLVNAMLGLSTVSANAQVQAGAVFSGDGLRNFYFAIGNYYQVPEREVVVVRERALPPDEVPVVFYAARQCHVQPTVIVDLRRRGMTWADIAIRFHQTPDIYYFRGGPPYGKAYGYWRNHPPRDVEVIEAVNTHFLSEYHGVTPDAVRAERSRGANYVVVAQNFEARGKKGDGDHGRSEHGRSGEHGHGKGHDRD
jgi:hypothetical protein